MIRSALAASASVRRSSSCASSTARSLSSFSLPDLPYDASALEPAISAQIMNIHHSKHHATYVNNLNVASEKLADAQAKGDISAIIALQGAIKFNGGGHLNHSIFWQNLAPTANGGGVMPDDAVGQELQRRIEAQWGTMDSFKTAFSAQTVAIQGSGWGWLGYDVTNNRLAIVTCANQDPLQATTGLVPLLGIDVWEHAYYLDYKNVRPDYVKNIWSVVNWKDVAARLEAALPPK